MKCLHHRIVACLVSMAVVAVAALGLPARAGAAELVILEQAGCYWCKVWDDEVGDGYNNSAEGKLAPLRRVDIHEKLPDDLNGLNKGRFTPTFVVWHEGREVGRIQGYPGGHFFWPMLQDILKQIDPSITDAAQSGSKS
jgi:hypothetical protein